MFPHVSSHHKFRPVPLPGNREPFLTRDHSVKRARIYPRVITPIGRVRYRVGDLYFHCVPHRCFCLFGIDPKRHSSVSFQISLPFQLKFKVFERVLGDDPMLGTGVFDGALGNPPSRRRSFPIQAAPVCKRGAVEQRLPLTLRLCGGGFRYSVRALSAFSRLLFFDERNSETHNHRHRYCAHDRGDGCIRFCRGHFTA